MDGIVLFDKISVTRQLIDEAQKILNEGPPVNARWSEELYRTKRRSDLTEIYKDLLDIDDEIIFNYNVSLLITSAIPMLNEIHHLWDQTRKKMISYLKSQCYDAYKHIEILLNPASSLPMKRCAAKDLIDYIFKPYGGILEGEAVLFNITAL